MNETDPPDLKATGQLFAGRLSIPMSELRFTYSRSSGPGGQNVNKVSSKAQLRWPVATSTALPPEVKERFLTLHRKRITVEGDLLVSSQRSRDQKRNVEDCLEKLRELLLSAAARPKRRKKTKPSRSSIERRLKAKRSRSGRKAGRRSPGMED